MIQQKLRGFIHTVEDTIHTKVDVNAHEKKLRVASELAPEVPRPKSEPVAPSVSLEIGASMAVISVAFSGSETPVLAATCAIAAAVRSQATLEGMRATPSVWPNTSNLLEPS